MRAFLAGAAITLALGFAGCNCGGPDGNDGGDLTDGGDAGDGDGGGDGGPIGGCVSGAQALQVTPTDSSATISGGETFPFSATAVLTAGGTLDVTNRVGWSVTRDDDSPPGTISAGGVYSPAAGTGGMVRIHATDGCLTGDTTFTMRLSSSQGGEDAGVVSRLDGGVDTTTAARLPKLVYPNDQTRFPRNIYKVLFQWQRAGNEVFRLSFDGTYSSTVIYTDGNHPLCPSTSTGACWEADAQTWQAIAGSNAGGTVTLTVDGVGPSGSTVYRAPPVTLGFSRRDVKGAIFYWSTTAAGVRRASVSDEAPEAYVVAKPTPTVLDNGASVKCVACHTVSRSGRKLFGGTQTSTANGEFVFDVTLVPPPHPVITTQITTANKGFGTFSPDDTRVVATIGNLLAEYDAADGGKVANLPVPAGTNPDWSPLGDELVYSNKGGDSPGGAGLDVIARDGGVWGAIRNLVPGGTLTNLFPYYTPDGRYIAFAKGKGGHGDKTLQLFMVKADGTEPPIELFTANRSLNNCIGVPCDATGRTNGQYENNMPTWAPPGDLDWVAFNSLRPYGVVYPTGGTQQIWVAAIDRTKLGQRESDGGMVDPSYPAFRFAFQNLSENNHRAYWTLDVRQEDAGPTCAPAGADCFPGQGQACCSGLECLGTSEVTYACLEPSSVPDAGSCIQEGAACDQTSGAPCCSGLACDVGFDGGVQCLFLIGGRQSQEE